MVGLFFTGGGAYILATGITGWEGIAAGALVLIGGSLVVCGLVLSGARLNTVFETVLRGLP